MLRFILFIVIMFFSHIIFGQIVYVVKYESQADFKVFVSKSEHEADLKVYPVNYPILAKGNNGKWFFGNSTQADKKIMFVYYPSQANLKIYYVKYESLAGWLNNDKKYLLKK